MASRWWSWWKLQASFWIHMADKSWFEKKIALEHLNDDSNVIWKIRANNGMKPKDAVNTYFKYKG